MKKIPILATAVALLVPSMLLTNTAAMADEKPIENVVPVTSEVAEAHEAPSAELDPAQPVEEAGHEHGEEEIADTPDVPAEVTQKLDARIAAPSAAAPAGPKNEYDGILFPEPMGSSGFVYPLPYKNYNVTSYYGARCLVTYNSGTWHGAVDLAAPRGFPTWAMTDGVITKIIPAIGSSQAGEVFVDHGLYKGKKLIISYTHSDDPTKYFKVGDRVKKGDVIADVGSSGAATGPHLHLALSYDGVYMDPLKFFTDNGVDLRSGAGIVYPSNVPTGDCNVYGHGDLVLLENADWESKVLSRIPSGTKFTITPDLPKNGYFAKAKFNGKTGWVPVSYLSNAPRANNPAPANIVNSGDAGMTFYFPRYLRSWLQDMPNTQYGQHTRMAVVPELVKVKSTGRIIRGTDWQEFEYQGTTGWIENTNMQIDTVRPDVVTKGAANQQKSVTGTQIYKAPTDSKKAQNNVVSVSANSPVVTTGDTYGNWVEIILNGNRYWVLSSSLVNRAAPPVVNNPSIKTDEIIARDGSGVLWNYHNLNAAKPGARTNMGGGWNSMKDILVTDFNADGVNDIIANGKDGKLYYYPGNKAGGFAARKVIGNGGWANLEIHAVKMKKTDKYPSIVARTPAGVLNVYPGTGSGLGKTRTIGSGWKGFAAINFTYFDADGNIDVLAQNTAGQQVLYRTNGSGFINEKRPVVGSGWKGVRSAVVTNLHGKNSVGFASINSAGKFTYYQQRGNKTWGPTKALGTGWTKFYIARQSI